jgi:hypothetical protein
MKLSVSNIRNLRKQLRRRCRPFFRRFHLRGSTLISGLKNLKKNGQFPLLASMYN